MPQVLFPAVIWAVLSHAVTSSSMLTIDEERLMESLMTSQQQFARPNVRPIRNSSNIVTVDLAFYLYNILDVNEKGQMLTTRAMIVMSWKNEFLSWNPSDYGGLRLTYLPTSSVWVPDIDLLNRANGEYDNADNVVVMPDGVSYCGRPIIQTSICRMNMRAYPYDQQNCSLTYISVLYPEIYLQLAFLRGRDNIIVDLYEESSEWELVTTGAQIVAKKITGNYWHVVEYYIVIRRSPGSYVYVLIVPSLLLSVLTPVLFCMPPSRPDRTSLGLSLFSSFFVLLLVLIQVLPSSAAETQLGIYYCYSMTLIAASTILSTITVVVSNKSQQNPQPSVPRTVYKIFVDIPANLSVKKLIYRYKSRVKSEQSSAKSEVTDDKNTVEQENWKVLATNLDRLFFTVACIAVTLAIAIIFPR